MNAYSKYLLDFNTMSSLVELFLLQCLLDVNITSSSVELLSSYDDDSIYFATPYNQMVVSVVFTQTLPCGSMQLVLSGTEVLDDDLVRTRVQTGRLQ